MRNERGKLDARKRRKSPSRQRPVTAERFHEARQLCRLTIAATAQLLRVSERTVLNWESGHCRIPYAAYRLMRIARGGQFWGEQWEGWFVRDDVLWSPEGHAFRPQDSRWWGLLIRQAHLWRTEAWRLRVAAQSTGDGRGEAAPALGLSLYSISRKPLSDGALPPLLPLLRLPTGLSASHQLGGVL